MAESPNLLRDIGYTKRYLTGEASATLANEAGVTLNRMSNIIHSAAIRARSAARLLGVTGPELDLMFLPPTMLRQNSTYVLTILEMHEKELTRDTVAVSLDDNLFRLHLPPRVYGAIKGKFPTVRDLIVHLNMNEGKLFVSGTSDYSRAMVLQTLTKCGLTKWLNFKVDQTLPDVLQDVLKFMDNPSSFSAKEVARLRADVASKAEVYKNYRK